MAIWHGTPSLEEINDRVRNTLVSHLGIRFTDVGADYLAAEMPVDERTCQPRGYLHGGASVALAETVGSYASALCVDMDNKFIFGQEINANHIRPVTEGAVTGIARPYHLGRSSHVWEIRINSEDGKLVCIARLTVSLRDR
jgi:1,4-dihydroxy-2-naphthoyl-CoA hydrolase